MFVIILGSRQTGRLCVEEALLKRRIITRPLTQRELRSVRQIIAAAPWKATRSDGEYRECPHHWLDRRGLGKRKWDYFAARIRASGSIRTWKAPWGKLCRYRYLIIDEVCYWSLWPVINKAPASTLEPLPASPVLPAVPLRKAATARARG
jgi:hypothetical protein